MDLGDCGPEAKLRPLIQALFIFCRGLHLLSPSSLGSIISSFLSLWSDMVPSFTLMPNSFSPPPPPTALASAGLSEQESPQSSWAGCAKPAEGRTQPTGRLLLRFLNIPHSCPPTPNFPTKRQTWDEKNTEKKKNSAFESESTVW